MRRPEQPFEAGRSPGNTYVTEFDAAYEASRAGAPSVQRNPLGRRGTDTAPEEGTALVTELTRMAADLNVTNGAAAFRLDPIDKAGELELLFQRRHGESHRS